MSEERRAGARLAAARPRGGPQCAQRHPGRRRAQGSRFRRLRLSGHSIRIRPRKHRMRVIIQARLGSTRLPGKILAPLAGKPLLWHVVRRLETAGSWMMQPWEVRVATTDQPDDDVTSRWCAGEGMTVMRGPAEDVLARYSAGRRGSGRRGHYPASHGGQPALLPAADGRHRGGPSGGRSGILVHPRSFLRRAGGDSRRRLAADGRQSRSLPIAAST